MHIDISLQDGVPIYRQIVNQVKYLIASGTLSPEEELPPIRVLAQQLVVTPNTIAKAYRELESEGLVTKRRGAGTYVSDAKSPLARAEQRKILSKRADALLAEARQFGFELQEVVDLLHQRDSAIERSIARENRRA